ncbi:hypothetical protein FRC07_011925 [Ceratobasidium sp. 392]|nr:hypothetical protein FRC07_011925 [Ceratobasidium sp. 392]
MKAVEPNTAQEESIPRSLSSPRSAPAVGRYLAALPLSRRQRRPSINISRVNDFSCRLNTILAQIETLAVGYGELSDRICAINQALEPEKALTGDIPVGSSWEVEKSKAEIIADTNVSPSAHKTSKRANEGSVEEVLPTPEPPCTPNLWPYNLEAQIREAHAEYRSAPIDLENIRSISFNPVAGSSPIRSRRPVNGYSIDYRARREISSHFEGYLDLARSSPIIPPSEAELPLVREPLPPITREYLSFGTFAELYIPHSQAPEPDTTFEGPVVSGRSFSRLQHEDEVEKTRYERAADETASNWA